MIILCRLLDTGKCLSTNDKIVLATLVVILMSNGTFSFPFVDSVFFAALSS